MTKRLEKLVVRCFRGATTPFVLEFDPQRPVVLIFGENGTGKSTIVDAIDLVCNREYGSLSDRSSTNPKDHAPSLGADRKKVLVTMTYGRQTWSGAMGSTGPTVTGPEGCPTAWILRRSHILSIVVAQPNKRYEALEPFIGVPNVEKCESSLREAILETERELAHANSTLRQANGTLSQLWVVEQQPAKDPLSWAREKAGEDQAELDSQLTTLRDVADKLGTCAHAEDNLAEAERAAASAEKRLRGERAKLEAAQSAQGSHDTALAKLLEDAKAFLEKAPGINHCPVCEKEICAAAVLRRLAERLQQMTLLLAAMRGVDVATLDSAGSQGVVQDRRQDFVLRALESALSIRDADVAHAVLPVSCCEDIKEHIEGEAVQDYRSVAQAARAFLGKTAPSKDALESKLKSLEKAVHLLNALRVHVNAIESADQRLGALRGELQLLATIEKALQTERKSYVERILAEVSESVDSLYQKVHPGEGIGRLRLYLKPHFRGSLEFDASFQSARQVPPQAYYSDSHLDTLGVCLFLALAKYFNDGNTIVVLDDVLTSADNVHMDRFIKMLHDEAPSFSHLVIATHYRPWRDQYRFSRGPASTVQLVELLQWSAPRGIRHAKGKHSSDELQECLRSEPLDRQAVGSKAGIFLENLLDFLAQRYERKLPRKAEPNYTLGELLGSLASLKKLMRIERVAPDGTPEIAIPISGYIERLWDLSWVRNQVGCHFNLAGLEVPDEQVKRFGQYTIDLGEALICDRCGEIPNRDKSGSYFQCQCARARLFPLREP